MTEIDPQRLKYMLDRAQHAMGQADQRRAVQVASAQGRFVDQLRVAYGLPAERRLRAKNQAKKGSRRFYSASR